MALLNKNPKVKIIFAVGIGFRALLIFGISYLVGSCGRGVSELSHTGECEGYREDWQNSDYVLPWPVGVSYAVSQGNCGPASHLGEQRFAYDFDMKIGSEIVAARAGSVIEMEESFSDGQGCSQANFIKIRHSDNTVGVYYHLTLNGSDVSVGQSVTQGATIGRSGNTGCSASAHLHFVVTDSEQKNSIPINFRNTLSNQRGLQVGKSYSAQ